MDIAPQFYGMSVPGVVVAVAVVGVAVAVFGVAVVVAVVVALGADGFIFL